MCGKHVLPTASQAELRRYKVRASPDTRALVFLDGPSSCIAEFSAS